MSITESTPTDLTEAASTEVAPAPPAAPAPTQTAPTQTGSLFSFGTSDRPVSIRLSLVVGAATLFLPWFLFVVSPASDETVEVAGYVTATSMLAMLALYPVLALAIRGSAALGKMMFGVVGLGLIAQAACAVDGHVSVGQPHFVAQVLSWLAFGVLAIGVTANTRSARV